MAPAELKELKLKHREFLNKGFIKPSISPWELRCCLLKRRMGLLGCILIIANSIMSPLRISIVAL